MRLSAYNKGILATLFAAILWSTAGLFIKLLPQNAFTILFYRSFCAAILFGLIFRKQIFRLNRQAIFISFIYAALLVTFVTSTKLTTAANAIFLQYMGVGLVLLFEPIILKTRLKRIDVWTTGFCFLGMILFFFEDFDSRGGWGMLIACISAFLLAALFIGQKSNPVRYHMGTIFWGNIWVALIGLPSYLASVPPTNEELAMLTFLGFIQIGLGYMLFTYGQRYIPATESSLIAMMEPILNPVWVLLGYGEYPSTWALIGGAIIIGSLLMRIIVMHRLRLKKSP